MYESTGGQDYFYKLLFFEIKKTIKTKKRQALLQVPHASISKLNSLYSALSPFSKKYLISGS